MIESMRAPVAAILLIAASGAAGSAWAAAPSPVGQWQTIDDATGKPKAIIEVTEQGGELSGKIVRLLNPSRPNPSCDQCEGERKGRPITGMTILWGVRRQGDQWTDGKILDPENGKVYSVRIAPGENGAELKVRGYLGFSALGRSQRWVRPTQAP